MRLPHIMMLSILVLLASCKLVESDIIIDKLQDKNEYTMGMVVACETFMGEKVEKIILNNKTYNRPETLDLRSPGYYRIEIYTGNLESETGVIRIVVLDPVRGDAEWGLPVWTPEGVIIETYDEQDLRLIYPKMVPDHLSSPLVLIVGGELTQSIVNLKAEIAGKEFLIKRGVGSAWAPTPGATPSILKIDHVSRTLGATPMQAAPLSISGSIDSNLTISADSYMVIPGDLSIPQGVTLTIESGSFITLDQGVNIYNEGTLRIVGSNESPVTITCSDESQFWGGVIGTIAGNSVEASHTLFCRSGHHTGGVYDYGHAHRQALFYNEYGSVSLDHCYMIDHAGQVFYPVFADLEISHCLVQRAITGGQANSADVVIDHSVFTDFPDDRRIYQDKDNDCFYLMMSDARISNSVFMYALDDGLDSGGSGDGEVRVTNTRFESIFHEGAALSSGDQINKNHIFSNCSFTDCGQGLELGYSSPNHLVTVDSCSFTKNGVGIRYGDNYSSVHEGHIRISNSQSLDNTVRDVWNMLREEWSADTSAMEFNNVWVSRADPVYPQLKIDE
ncbi:MAG: hypothetical protein GY790_00755 [Bacteroidetes bacterium]|nr:hypothetical protein [Bacteroidota bacterium]